MSLPINFDRLVGQHCHAIFGEAVLYRSRAGDRPFTINGIFDEAYHEVSAGGDDMGAAIATLQPVLGVRIAEFPYWPPGQGDQCVITAQLGHGGGVFEVKNFEPDGKGAAKLMLTRLGD